MIIRMMGAGTRELDFAQESLAELTRTWGHDLTTAGALEAHGGDHDEGKAIDPVSLSALVLSIPSAVLAVVDLADRIQKRRRARNLIEHAQQLSAQSITVQIVVHGEPRELAALDPDQLLDAIAHEDETHEP